MQLGTQDREQRHRTQNIDGMDFPTLKEHDPFQISSTRSATMQIRSNLEIDRVIFLHRINFLCTVVVATCSL